MSRPLMILVAAPFRPIPERVLARSDACLRMGGPCEGADRLVAVARHLGKPVFADSDEVL